MLAYRQATSKELGPPDGVSLLATDAGNPGFMF